MFLYASIVNFSEIDFIPTESFFFCLYLLLLFFFMIFESTMTKKFQFSVTIIYVGPVFAISFALHIGCSLLKLSWHQKSVINLLI